MLFNRLDDGIVSCQRDMEYDDWYDNESDIVNFLWALDRENTDLSLFGEEFCLGNWEMGFTLMDYYADVVYVVPFSYCEKYKNGDEIRLYPRKVTMEDRVAIASDMGDPVYVLRIVTDYISDGEFSYENNGYWAESLVFDEPEEIPEIMRCFGYDIPDECSVDYDGDIVEVWYGDVLLAYCLPCDL